MNKRDDRRREPAEPYDTGGPFDAESFLGGFTEEAVEVPVDPGSPLGGAMAKAREAGIAGPDDEFDEGSIRPTPVGE